MKLYEQAGLSPNLDALRALARPGCCLACDRALGPQTTGRRRKVHANAKCLRVYHRAAELDRELRDAIKRVTGAVAAMARAADQLNRMERKHLGHRD